MAYLNKALKRLMSQLRLEGGIEEQTLSGDVDLDELSANILRVDPGGSNRNVDLPAEETSDGLPFFILNVADAAENITVRNDAGSTIVVLGRYEGAIVGCDGSNWKVYGFFTEDVLGVLAATTTGKGASLIGVEDSADYFTGATVEALLAELGATRVRRALVTVTAAQLRALRATPQTLVAAPGSGKYLELVSAHLWLDFGTVAHDGPANAGDDLGIRYTNGSGQVVATQEATGFVNGASDQHRELKAGAAPVATATDVVPVTNAALVLHNVGAAEYTGTGDSPVKVEVLYRVRTLEPAA